MQAEEVEITGNIRNVLDEFLQKKTPSRVAVLVDENTQRDCLPIVQEQLTDSFVILIPSGEDNKTLETCQMIWDQLTNANFDRKSLFINLGGGVIGDMGGFCAATYKRGIPFLNIPTTLLSQVDASVGGKLGIDYKGFKNHIGVFSLPEKVFIDPVFLETLPERELRSGFAEVIKHSLIADASHWPETRDHSLREQNWEAHIRHSVEIKSRIVNEDPFEKGPRKILNFGHTIGHALETDALLNGPERVLHGEAIAAGMIAEAWLSHRKLGLPESELQEIVDYILKIYGKIRVSPDAYDRIGRMIRQDKKNEKGIANFSLIERIGKCAFNINVNADEIQASLDFYAKA